MFAFEIHENCLKLRGKCVLWPVCVIGVCPELPNKPGSVLRLLFGEVVGIFQWKQLHLNVATAAIREAEQ